jgi:hypothetical protein
VRSEDEEKKTIILCRYLLKLVAGTRKEIQYIQIPLHSDKYDEEDGAVRR